MIKNNLKNLMIQHNVGAFKLARETGITYMNIWNMLHRETTAIQYKTLEKLCKYFKCEVQDILVKSGD